MPYFTFQLKGSSAIEKKSKEPITQKGTLKECGDRNYWNRKKLLEQKRNLFSCADSAVVEA